MHKLEKEIEKWIIYEKPFMNYRKKLEKLLLKVLIFQVQAIEKMIHN